MITIDSAYPYEETYQRLMSAINARGLTLFASIDHSGGARDFGLELADEAVLVFGHPRTGTPLMRSDPRVGIELPLRLLVWAQEDRVRVGYTDPREWEDAYAVAEHRQILEAMAMLLDTLAREVAD
jgi:uncharacterized protein (DUF302 family)